VNYSPTVWDELRRLPGCRRAQKRARRLHVTEHGGGVLGAAGGELCRPRALQRLWRRAVPRRKMLRSEDVRFDTYVASECLTCFSCFEKMLQVFHDDVAKVDLDVVMLHVSRARCKCVI
jgi:hypothetical protein